MADAKRRAQLFWRLRFSPMGVTYFRGRKRLLTTASRDYTTDRDWRLMLNSETHFPNGLYFGQPRDLEASMTDAAAQQVATIMAVAAKMAATIIRGSPDPATAMMVAVETLVQVGLFTEAHGLHASADALEDRIVRHLREAFAVRRGRQRIAKGHQPS